MSQIKFKTIYLAAYLLLLTAHLILIWSMSYIPTKDGPSHIYNLAILKDLLHGGEIWGEYYSYNLQLVPNLGFHIFTYPLLNFLDPWQAEKLFLSLYICLMCLSIPVFLKAFDRAVFPVCFFVFPVIFNLTLLSGFYSYCIAVPFFILFFSLSWAVRHKNFLWKILTYTLCGSFLFCLHLIPFIFYLISLFSMTISQAIKAHSRKNIIIKSIASISPLLLILFYHLTYSVSSTFSDFYYLFSSERLVLLIIDFLTFTTLTFNIIHSIPLFFFIAGFFTLFYLSIRTVDLNAKYRDIFCTPYFLTAFILSVIYFLVPFDFAGGSFFNERFPWVIFLLLLPLIKFPERDHFLHHKSALMISIVMLIFAFNVTFLWKHSQLVDDYTKGLSVPIPRNSLIMNYKQFGSDTSRVDFLLHSISHYALTHKAVDIGNYEARLDYFPVQFKTNMPPVPSIALIELSPWEIDWDGYPDIEYLIAWEMGLEERNNISRSFDMVFKKDDLSIWRRN